MRGKWAEGRDNSKLCICTLGLLLLDIGLCVVWLCWEERDSVMVGEPGLSFTGKRMDGKKGL